MRGGVNCGFSTATPSGPCVSHTHSHTRPSLSSVCLSLTHTHLSLSYGFPCRLSVYLSTTLSLSLIQESRCLKDARCACNARESTQLLPYEWLSMNRLAPFIGFFIHPACAYHPGFFLCSAFVWLPGFCLPLACRARFCCVCDDAARQVRHHVNAGVLCGPGGQAGEVAGYD